MNRILTAAVLLCAATGPSATRAASIEATEQAIAAQLPSLISFRHEMHRNPELGNREVETAAKVARELRGLGLEVTENVAHTGVVGVLRGGRSGPVVALRADMDALPVTEATDLPFKSTKRGTYKGQEVGLSHACGHDIHTTVALGAAKTLASLRDRVAGTVVFIFQPAEEGPPPGERGGAELMLAEGVFDEHRPQAIFGLHSWPSLSVGQVGFTPGATFAAVDTFGLTIRGKQAHGAMPHLSADPVVMAAQAILALQTIRSRNLSPMEPSVVTVGVVRGGERHNIIPSEVRLEGTVRTYSAEVRETVRRRFDEILDGVTRAGGGSYEIDTYAGYAPPTVNDDALATRSRRTLEATLGAENVIDLEPSTAGEDFAFFANEVPGFYYRLGVTDPEKGSGGVHTPTFRADDAAIEVGVRAMVGLVLAELGGS